MKLSDQNEDAPKSSSDPIAEREKELAELKEKCIRYENEIALLRQKFETTLDNIPEAILISIPGIQIIEANARAQQIFGYTFEEFKTKNRTHLFVQNKALEDFTKEREQKGHAKAELVGIRKSGELFPVFFSTKSFTDPTSGELRYSSTLIDLTEEKWLRSLLNETSVLAKIGGWEFILATQKLNWTDETKKIHELPPEYEPDLHSAINFYQEGWSRDHITWCVKEAIENGRPYEEELKIITAKGREKWVLAMGKAEFHQGKCSRIFGIFQDIDQRKKAELALEKSQQYYRSLFENNPDSVYSIQPDGQLLTANGAMENLLGATPGSLIGRSLLDFFPDDQKSNVQSIIRNPEEAQTFESSWISVSGTRLTLLITHFPIVVHGQVIAINGIAKDISSLRRIERERSLILESILDYFYVLDHDFRFTYVNASASEVMGIPADELLGRNIFDVFPALAEENFYRYVKQALETRQPVHFEYYSKVVDTWFDESLYPTEEGLTVFFKSLTERKKAEEELKKSNERFTYVTKATFDAIWDTDLATGQVYWGEGFYTLFGYSPKDLAERGHDFIDYLHPEDRERIKKSFDSALSGPYGKWTEQYRFRKSDNTYAMVQDKAIIIRDEDGKAIRITGAMQDVTQQKLRESWLQLMESVITNSTDSIVIFEKLKDSKDSLPHVLYLNAAFTRMTGFTLEDLIGKSIKALLRHENSEADLARINHAFSHFIPLELEFENRKKDGSLFWQSFTLVPVLSHQGKVQHWISIQRDTTKRKNRELEWEKMVTELTTTNKELKQFSYITSHNMRSSLSNLLAISEILDLSTIENAQTRELLEGFKISTRNLNDTLNDLIDILILKEKKAIETSEISFDAVYQKVADSIQPLISDSNALIHTNFSSAPLVHFNMAYLESIFLNMITNSIRYAKKDKKPIVFIYSISQEDGSVQLVFEDNGMGFNYQKVKNKIFGLYQKFHNHPDSKGIGLYLVHSQITSLGGTIEVESEENEGTKFTITFKGKANA